MTLRFKSIPVHPDGQLNPDDVRSHELEVSAARCYLPSLWVSAGVFILSATFFFVLCVLIREGGFHLLADGEEAYLPPVLGAILSLPAFIAAFKIEMHFLMHLCALEDRAGDFAQFRFR